jgi:hypothetical protein
MPDVATLEAINREQLATATDRLLLRGTRWSQRRPTRSRGAVERLPVVHALHTAYAPHAPLARGANVEISHARRKAHPAPPRRPWFFVHVAR